MFDEMHEILGDYTLLRVIARGASAVVHLAEDRRDGQRFAIKVADYDERWSDLEAERFRRLFANEASLAGRLVHPNIARMHSAVLGEQVSYIVMEYVDGHSLRHYCQADQRLPRAQVVQLLFNCARAIDFAHGYGVLHRDLKPANILLSERGEVKIIDFGAAQIAWASQTQLGGFLGSPAYMAPEQLLERTPSPATDVYALGVVLYELLGGSHPFPGDGGPGTVHRILHEDPLPLGQLAPDTPAALQTLVHRAIARDPRDRYANCFTLARDLMACAR